MRIFDRGKELGLIRPCDIDLYWSKSLSSLYVKLEGGACVLVRPSHERENSIHFGIGSFCVGKSVLSSL